MKQRTPRAIVIDAALVGALVDEIGAGRVGAVLSIHDTVVNVLAETDGRLLSIVHDAADMSDRAICVPGRAEWARLRRVVAEASSTRAPVVRCGHSLLFENESCPVSLALGSATKWVGRPGTSLAAVALPTVRRAAERLAAHVAARGRGFAPLAEFGNDTGPATAGNDPFLGRARDVLARATREGTGALAHLVGLGQGFTPAGDDFVAGVALAFAVRGVPLPENLATAVRAALDGTTPGGATLLYLVLRNSHPAYQLNFVERFAGTLESTDHRAALDILAHHGATSGFDMAAGFCWAMRSLVPVDGVVPDGTAAVTTGPDPAG